MPLIRARSVVQVHPGPPFKSSVNTRLFSLFSFSGLSRKKPFCQPFVNFTIGRMALHSGLASIRLCRERCPVTSKDVEGIARHCKTVQGARQKRGRQASVVVHREKRLERQRLLFFLSVRLSEVPAILGRPKRERE